MAAPSIESRASIVAARSRESTLMNIQFERDAVDGVPVLKVSGNLDFDTSGRLLMQADDAWDPEKKLLVLDLAGVQHIDSAGVTELVLVKKRARRQGGNVVLAHVSDVTRYVLDIMGLQEPLEVYPTVEAALAAQR
jgi:anti-sigma B factor antagonist